MVEQEKEKTPRPWQRMAETWLVQPVWAGERPRLVFLAFLLLLAVVYGYVCALQISQSNQNRADSDQQNNIRLARESRGDWLPYRTDGVVNPLWPWLAGKTVVSANPDEDSQAFRQGKWLNCALGLALVVGLGLWAGGRLPLLPAMTLVSLCAFGAMAQRGPFFQPEPLFYIFFFLCVWAGGALFLRNSLGRYALFGALCGLCYLAKASVTPFLGIALGLATVAAVLCMAPRVLFFWPGLGRQLAENGFSWRRHWAGLALCLGVFALMLLPRGIYSQREFGAALHSFPKYWIWQDDFGKESTSFMLNWNQHRETAESGGEPLPSAGGYIRKHGLPYLWERLEKGSTNALVNFLQPEDRPPWAKQSKKPKPWKHVLTYRGYYLGVLALWLVVLGGWVLATRQGPRVLGREVPAATLLVLLAVGSFVAFTLAYGLYEVIGKGDRFMLSLYMPLALALVLGERGLLTRWRGALWPHLVGGAVHLALLWALCQRLGDVSRFPYFR